MIKKISLGLLLLLATSPALSGVTYWGMRADLWQKNSDFENLVYVQGLFDGLIFSDTTVHGTKLSTQIDVEQYRKAVDTLYSDYKNALIPVPFLLRVITLEIQGAGKEEVEKELQSYRLQFSKK